MISYLSSILVNDIEEYYELYQETTNKNPEIFDEDYGFHICQES